MNRNLTALSLMTLLLAACVPGCLFSSEVEYTTCSDDDNCLKIAFEVKEEYQNTDENPQKLGDRLGELMGQEVEIYPVASAAATIEALRFGNADIGFLDGGAAWLSWNEYGLQVAAAEQKADGRAYYHAVAWVHKDSDMAQASMNGDVDQALTLMEGKISCHTSALGSSGMLLPMGYLINNSYMDVVGDVNEIDSLHATVTSHFSEDSSIPDSGTPYYRYIGSLRCLAEHTLGDATDYISFAKDPTVPDYCGDDPQDWCFEGDFTSTEDFYPIGGYDSETGEINTPFGKAPSHPVMYNPDVFTPAEVQALQDAFTTMSNNDADLKILDDVLSTPGMTIIDTESHLGSYGDAIGDVPGITAYFNDKISKTSSSSSSDTPWGLIVPSVLIVAGGAVFYFTRVKASTSSAPDAPEEATSEAPIEE
jgi:ABC-type phosphate/phosphonate transport system substrate-binding protein